MIVLGLLVLLAAGGLAVLRNHYSRPRCSFPGWPGWSPGWRVGESIPEPPAASATASESTRWHEIQAMFVDDPRSAVETAAGLVDDSSQAVVAFVKDKQDSLRARAAHTRTPAPVGGTCA